MFHHLLYKRGFAPEYFVKILPGGFDFGWIVVFINQMLINIVAALLGIIR